jgi:tRNA(fMet)-specific endonuclease VapC
MTFLPDTNACISLPRRRNPRLVARWQSARATDVVLCSVVTCELRYGAERSDNPMAEHAKLDHFLGQFDSMPFDNACGRRCAGIRRTSEQAGSPIGPHDLQIAAIARHHRLTLVTHNLREFGRVAGLVLEDWEA